MPRDGGSCIRAVVRVRPLLQHELDRGQQSCCEVADAQTMLVKLGSSNTHWRKYSFDACLPEDRTQKQVFQESGVIHLLDSATIGFSATVLAYGQTGSGKTHTIIGNVGHGDAAGKGDEVTRNDGLVMRAAKRLFKKIGNESTFSVGVSFAEIFNAPGAVNECISDLLNPDAGNLQVRFNQKQGFFINDLAVVDCKSLADVRAALEAGVQTRRVCAHALNKDSSRSHALFTLHIDSERTVPGSEDEPPVKRYGKITFVDLAGSERLKESLSEGNARKETQAINKSLFTLGQVISQLAHGGADRHVPYRNSKLTQLLQESFGGDALCLMVTCISPASTYAEESINSLNYAQKAMKIQNTPVVRLDEQQQVLYDLKSENANLRRELERYRQRFGALSPRGTIVALPESQQIRDDGQNLGTEADGQRRRPDVLKVSPSSIALDEAGMSPKLVTESAQVSPTRWSQGANAANRGYSAPPPETPQVSPKPPRPSVGQAPPAPQSHSAPSSARDVAAREVLGSYASAMAKRQQMKQRPVHKRSPSDVSTSAPAAVTRQLPPLPSRGSSGNSVQRGRATSPRRDDAKMLPATPATARPEVVDSFPGRGNAVITTTAVPTLKAPPSSKAAAVSSSPSSSDDMKVLHRSGSRLRVADEQLESLNRAPWSEWQLDFGDGRGRQRERQEASNSSENRGGRAVSSVSRSESRTSSYTSSRPPSVARAGSDSTRLQTEVPQAISDHKASDVSSYQGMSLADLNNKLSSMQQATAALMLQRRPHDHLIHT